MADEADTGATAAGPSSLYPRHDATFPALSEAEIDRLRRFGTVQTYSDGAMIFETGKVSAAALWVVLRGNVAVSQRDGLGQVTPVIEQGARQFLGELASLSGRPALVDGHAEGEVELLAIPLPGLRALLVAEAELGEKLMRAMILRRVSLIAGGSGGPVLIGSPGSAGLAQLQNFLSRNGHPHHLLDPAVDAGAAAVVARFNPKPDELPLVVAPDGKVLRNPGETELAWQLGLVSEATRATPYDVAVVGAGPAGLATAVYAASEGLSVVVLDQRAFGGQAGASARIENYLGFPTGISGQALAGRAFVQAQKFGADVMIPMEVKTLDCSRQDGLFRLDLDCGERLRARSVVVASGARYRRPAIANLEAFEGRGVWYWASPIEAQLCRGQDVVLVGGGNSAGQAAVFLSGHARTVRMMVRGEGLAASMSRYLIDRIAGAGNIEVMPHTEIVALEGAPETGIERVRWRNRRTRAEADAAIHNVFLFVGADPATAWLEGCGVKLDRTGFVLTGPEASDGTPRAALESTVPGVFAVGDVRSGSVKRVGGAIGEGAQVVATLHRFLADSPTPAL